MNYESFELPHVYSYHSLFSDSKLTALDTNLATNQISFDTSFIINEECVYYSTFRNMETIAL